MLYSLPVFWVGTLIIIFFGGGDFFAWFPAAGLHSLDYSDNWPWWRKLGDQRAGRNRREQRQREDCQPGYGQ